MRPVIGAAVAACCVLASAAAPAPLRLGGIAIGASVLDAVKSFGMPDVVQTTDDGHFWQWSQAGGLDREVITDDALDVQAVLVARAAPSSTAQPAEFPLLGESAADAAGAMRDLGAVRARERAGAWTAWRSNGGVLVVEDADGTVARIRAFDEPTAAIRGYDGVMPSPHAHHAPVLLKEFTPAQLPPAGTAVVRVEIDARGGVTQTRVIVSSGDPAVDRFVVDSMAHSTFAPASCDGAPCAGVFLQIDGMMR